MQSRKVAKRSMPATGKVVLDTSVVVGVLRPGLMERMRGAEELLVPLVVLGELEYGANLATPPQRQREVVGVWS
jgi:predicted nucleic acid-binding protein